MFLHGGYPTRIPTVVNPLPSDVYVTNAEKESDSQQKPIGTNLNKQRFPKIILDSEKERLLESVAVIFLRGIPIFI